MIVKNAPLAPFTTLRAGGKAEKFLRAPSLDQMAEAISEAHATRETVTVLGCGSNVLPSDHGVKGLVVVNACRKLEISGTGEVFADTGLGFQELFLKTAQAGLGGFEYAVGIPGTIGGALISNAGAYRSNISEFLTDLEICRDSKREWVKPDFMEFAYRDSVLRRPNPPAIALLRARFKLNAKPRKAIYDEAREYQRQRISKQPPPASAGSFFKNVNDAKLAQSLDTLPEGLKKAGVVPSGYLIEAAGLKGRRLGGAMLSSRHANFMLNVGQATATDIRNLAELAKTTVADKFGVTLEEEVLYLGDWSGYRGPK